MGATVATEIVTAMSQESENSHGLDSGRPNLELGSLKYGVIHRTYLARRSVRPAGSETSGTEMGTGGSGNGNGREREWERERTGMQNQMKSSERN